MQVSQKGNIFKKSVDNREHLCYTANVSRENVLSGVALGGRSRKGELMKIVLKIFLVVVILLVALKLNAM